MKSRGEMSASRNNGRRSNSRLARYIHHQQSTAPEDTSEHEVLLNEDSARANTRSHPNFRSRAESSPLGASFSSSSNQRTPVRSYYQRSFQGLLGMCVTLGCVGPKLNGDDNGKTQMLPNNPHGQFVKTLRNWPLWPYQMLRLSVVAHPHFAIVISHQIRPQRL